MPIVETVPLHETTRERYLNYALSVITSRALPDIRDGLKPVQRRILYAMYHNLRLTPDSRFRKSATVVGEVMGKYHPHGDSAIYDAMVRMAQDFSLRNPLVNGHGNFGSIDGDNAAAMRYTEAKLRPISASMLDEIRQDTVPFRANYDGSLSEPVVLPTRVPNLLVNGASGIAVGMATNIPPHNLGEVTEALVALIDDPSLENADLLDYIEGPDFPTGGRILNSREELEDIYATGQGTIEMRAEYTEESLGGRRGIIIESIPYGLKKSDLVEDIADHIRDENIPQLVDVRDESTDDIRIVLALKRGADTETAMAYLYKHTPLQHRFHVNMTCLVPVPDQEVPAPQRVDLKQGLREFLKFRLRVVTRRLRHELDQLERRIHILKGFAIIFDALDEAIRIVRSSENKSDAAAQLMDRFDLDAEQTDAVLETKLYRLSKLEIDAILGELEQKQARAEEIRELLADRAARWAIVREEIQRVGEEFGDRRRSDIAGSARELEYSERDYIVKEDVYVIVTRGGWVKRQLSYTDLDAIRVREGDEVGWALFGSTRAAVAFLTNHGTAYTIRINELPGTSGYGDPIQKYFDFADGEKVVGVISLDTRVLPVPRTEGDRDPELFDQTNGQSGSEEVALPEFICISSAGYASRYSVENIIDPSTKNGRRYARLGDGTEIVTAQVCRGDENVCLASRNGRVLIFPVNQISSYKGAAKGVKAIDLEDEDFVLGATLSRSARDGLEVETNRGRREIVRTTKYDVSNRANKGDLVIKRGHLANVIYQPVEVRPPDE
jgi:DNA gyrase subunit A